MNNIPMVDNQEIHQNGAHANRRTDRSSPDTSLRNNESLNGEPGLSNIPVAGRDHDDSERNTPNF